MPSVVAEVKVVAQLICNYNYKVDLLGDETPKIDLTATMAGSGLGAAALTSIIPVANPQRVDFYTERIAQRIGWLKKYGHKNLTITYVPQPGLVDVQPCLVDVKPELGAGRPGLGAAKPPKR
jgi:hypothetical protein